MKYGLLRILTEIIVQEAAQRDTTYNYEVALLVAIISVNGLPQPDIGLFEWASRQDKHGSVIVSGMR